MPAMRKPAPYEGLAHNEKKMASRRLRKARQLEKSRSRRNIGWRPPGGHRLRQRPASGGSNGHCTHIRRRRYSCRPARDLAEVGVLPGHPNSQAPQTSGHLIRRTSLPVREPAFANKLDWHPRKVPPPARSPFERPHSFNIGGGIPADLHFYHFYSFGRPGAKLVLEFAGGIGSESPAAINHRPFTRRTEQIEDGNIEELGF